MVKRICFFTATRAEYGLLSPLMRAVSNSCNYKMQLIVSGAHLAPEFGHTVDQIERDGFIVDRKIEMLLSSDTHVGASKSLGLAIIGLVDALNDLRPDLLVVLGDRYELLAAGSVALISRIPIVHIHGGEITEGAVDDSVRHAMTKLSYLHFTSTDEYRNRVISMGEAPERVFNVGAIGLDSVYLADFMSEEEIRSELGLGQLRYFLVTFHPATVQSGAARRQLLELFAALDYFPEFGVVFTKANADAEGRLINSMLQEYCERNPSRTFLFSSLGQRRYLSLARICAAVVGNSSSGIIEIPSLGVPTVNVGDRQKGRTAADSVITVEVEQEQIISAIRVAVSPEFKCQALKTINPYGSGQTTRKILDVLDNLHYPLANKIFYNQRVN